MFVPFNTLPETSKIWIYQADEFFDETEKKTIAASLENFINSWSTHGTPLQASYTIEFDKFIILAVNEDEVPASGCSIDKSTAAIKQLENLLGKSLLNRNQVAYFNNDKIETVKLPSISKYIKEEKIKPDTIIFNNTITHLDQLKTAWQANAQSSWLSLYFSK